MTGDVERRLIEQALQVRRRAYAKYSEFQVGAALLSADSRIFTGCNVENASFGLTICAERAAAFAAISAGCSSWTALAVAAPGAAPPCGACRQVLAEFCEDLPIVLVDVGYPEQWQRTSLMELFPRRFHL